MSTRRCLARPRVALASSRAPSSMTAAATMSCPVGVFSARAPLSTTNAAPMLVGDSATPAARPSVTLQPNATEKPSAIKSGPNMLPAKATATLRKPTCLSIAGCTSRPASTTISTRPTSPTRRNASGWGTTLPTGGPMSAPRKISPHSGGAPSRAAALPAAQAAMRNSSKYSKSWKPSACPSSAMRGAASACAELESARAPVPRFQAARRRGSEPRATALRQA